MYLAMDDLSRFFSWVLSRFFGKKDVEPVAPDPLVLADSVARNQVDVALLQGRISVLEEASAARRPRRTPPNDALVPGPPFPWAGGPGERRRPRSAICPRVDEGQTRRPARTCAVTPALPVPLRQRAQPGSLVRPIAPQSHILGHQRRIALLWRPVSAAARRPDPNPVPWSHGDVLRLGTGALGTITSPPRITSTRFTARLRRPARPAARPARDPSRKTPALAAQELDLVVQAKAPAMRPRRRTLMQRVTPVKHREILLHDLDRRGLRDSDGRTTVGIPSPPANPP